jgi:outer membrane protein OmpA-like peptidoglycan-associated protein
MKMKKTILSCLLALGFLTASAQDQQPKTEYVFNPHWYVQIQPLGIQHTLGEVDFGDLNSYNVQAAIGRQFNPVVGARLAVNAWQSKAGSKIENYKYKWDWKYVAPSVDVTFNLSNLFCGFNPNRVFNFGVFAGLGANIGFSNDKAADARAAIKSNYPSAPNYYFWDEADNLAYLWSGTKVRLLGQAGVNADFKVSDAVSIGVELSANTLNDKYNSKKAGNWDWYFNALAGVKINLGSTYSTREIPPIVPETLYVEKIVEKEVIKEVPGPPATVEPLRRDVFFLINKTNIRPEEAQKVKDIADYLNAHPTAKVMVTGYADAGTGNNKINDRLAAGRADAVVKSLKKDYGIAESRISYDSKGSRVQPFAENDMNRVSICIAE